MIIEDEDRWIEVYYNHGKNFLNIDVLRKLRQPLNVEVFNAIGALEYVVTLKKERTGRVQKVSLPSLETGVYSIRLSSSNFEKRIQIPVGRYIIDCN